MNKGKVTFTLGEEEFIKALINQFGITRIEAIEYVIQYKEDQMSYYESLGKKELVEQLKKELGIT
ncbi:MAG: hypothetical protein QXL17_02695 [Candidatus Thermoplasmatota archaeon]